MISQLFSLVIGFLRLILKDILYGILAKIYYSIFRLKKDDLTKKVIKEISYNQLAYLFILVLTTGFIINNLSNPINPNFSSRDLSKTILAHLIPSDINNNPNEILITETAIPDKVLQAQRNKRLYQQAVISKKLSPPFGEINNQKQLIIFNKNNNLVFKPIIINNASSYNPQNYNQGTTIKRQKIISYTIKSGDTISAIARYFGISINTILWANHLTAYSLIRPGDKLSILPTSGVLYTAQSGDTISGLSARYKIAINKILAANKLSTGLKIGQKIIIPGGRYIRPYVATTRRTTRSAINTSYTGLSTIHNLIRTSNTRVSPSGLIWPTVGHVITQYYSWHHHGVDIANRIGTPIFAAASGRVIIAQGGWNGGYGNTVLLNNGNGIETRYGHASRLLVRPGEYVKRGQTIALMGSTGNSTGPHLHFEVLINGIRRNPLNYIR